MQRHISAQMLHSRLSPEPSLVFARYIGRVAPESPAIQGPGFWALGGPMAGRFEVPEVWAYCEGWDLLPYLLDAMATVLGGEISMALVDQPVGQMPAGLCATNDCHLFRDRRIDVTVNRDIHVQSLNLALFDRDNIHPEISAALGNPQALVADFGTLDHFYGAFYQGQLAAVAEINVEDGHHVAIQQVFTASTLRNKGIARHLVADVCNRALDKGRHCLYVCDSQNFASLALAKGLGFVEILRAPNLKLEF